ncbi:MAG: paraquat-inducible membrane protein A [Gammaproteobacteria bacterium]|nr:MAG: paraquat-inducible membrane protein A [Gammaproteobacteria bacterium]
MNKSYSALKQGFLCCRQCHKVILEKQQKVIQCPRCQSKVYPRIPNSLSQSWALLISGFILYIPANVLPIMTLTKGGVIRTDTIMSGIINLANIGMAPIAVIVFIASILVPALKMVALAMILLATQFKWTMSTYMRTQMYRMIEFVGRWSMLDVFVISILLGIVKFNKIASVDIEPAGLLFAIVIILTMLAAMRFDSRLIWDDINELS